MAPCDAERPGPRTRALFGEIAQTQRELTVGMQCERCQETATVHLTDVSNGAKNEVHLCEPCAKQQGVTIKSYMHKSSAASASASVSSELFGGAGEVASETSGKDAAGLVCGTCGTSYRSFRSTGKFGCPDCYEAFGPKLGDLLEKIHSRNQHVGKVPARASVEEARDTELRALRVELDEAVRSEAYEKAAQIRDRIQRVEGRARSREG